jgi:hypothetical protein
MQALRIASSIALTFVAAAGAATPAGLAEVIAWPPGAANPVCSLGAGVSKINVLVPAGPPAIGSELRLVHTPRGSADWSIAVLSTGLEPGGVNVGAENLSYVIGSKAAVIWVRGPEVPHLGWVHRACIPADPTLLGKHLYAQAALWDPTGTYPHPVCLSRALELVLEAGSGGLPCTPGFVSPSTALPPGVLFPDAVLKLFM